LRELYQKFKFSGSTVFNLNESGLSAELNEVPKVVTVKRQKVGRVTSGQRGKKVTCCLCYGCEWSLCPSCHVCSQEDKEELLAGDFPETITMCSILGYGTSALFI
jgi:hypothetical protein